ncbi:MAG: translation initiation factor IF-2 [Bacillota bacterium]
MSDKIRVYELARELGISSKTVIHVLAHAGIQVKNHMSTLSSEAVQLVKDTVAGKKKAEQKREAKQAKPRPAPSEARGAQQQQTQQHVQQQASQQAQQQKKGQPGGRSVDARSSTISVQPGKPGNVRSGAAAAPMPAAQKQVTVRQTRPAMPARPAGVPKTLQAQKAAVEERPKSVTIEGSLTVKELAQKTGIPVTQLIKKLMSLGVMATINQTLDADTAAVVTAELGFEVVQKQPELSLEEKLRQELNAPDPPDKLKPRPPVVTVMGHVDHGKTSLLDAIRQTRVTAQEAGGITQHIGASTVEVNGRKIVFLDTPGHEAFTAMRARGIKVTDIAVLVVAADDGVMPQTVEAINHARAAKVPIIVALNKIDKPTAKPDRVKGQLAELGLVPEDWGGDVICVPVSARQRTNLDQLLEMVLLVADMLELKANPDKKAHGVVIEARLDKGRGPVATVLVQGGTLNVGDAIVCGTTYGRVRAMMDDKGRRIKHAGPSVPVEVIGLASVPGAGDVLQVVESEKVAKEVAELRAKKAREQQFLAFHRVSLEELVDKAKEGEVTELNVIVKADVQGSIEAVKQALSKVDVHGVKVNVIHAAVGGITENDVMLAAASHAIIVGFNVRPDANAAKAAEQHRIEVRTYKVIYELIDDIESAAKGLIKPKKQEVVHGRAEVRATFRVPKVGTVAGCYVTEGKVIKDMNVRVIRDGVVVYDGQIASLKRFKEDVKEVPAGYECGVGLDRFQDIKEGDALEVYSIEEVRAS